MSASMAEVLAGHQLYVNTSHGDAWNPPEESASCSCGVDLGGWVASGADWEWPDGWGKEHGEHVAEVLAANGYGKLEEAQARAYDKGYGHGKYDQKFHPAMSLSGTPRPEKSRRNPYRAATERGQHAYNDASKLRDAALESVLAAALPGERVVKRPAPLGDELRDLDDVGGH